MSGFEILARVTGARLEVVSKPQIALKVEAQTDERAQHT
jgi:hypothetical protein